MMEPFPNTEDYQRLQRETRMQLAQHLAAMPVDPDRIAQLLQILLNVSELQVSAVATGAKHP